MQDKMSDFQIDEGSVYIFNLAGTCASCMQSPSDARAACNRMDHTLCECSCTVVHTHSAWLQLSATVDLRIYEPIRAPTCVLHVIAPAIASSRYRLRISSCLSSSASVSAYHSCMGTGTTTHPKCASCRRLSAGPAASTPTDLPIESAPLPRWCHGSVTSTARRTSSRRHARLRTYPSGVRRRSSGLQPCESKCRARFGNVGVDKWGGGTG